MICEQPHRKDSPCGGIQIIISAWLLILSINYFIKNNDFKKKRQFALGVMSVHVSCPTPDKYTKPVSCCNGTTSHYKEHVLKRWQFTLSGVC